MFNVIQSLRDFITNEAGSRIPKNELQKEVIKMQQVNTRKKIKEIEQKETVIRKKIKTLNELKESGKIVGVQMKIQERNLKGEQDEKASLSKSMSDFRRKLKIN